jgi:RHS repeat-associated protein
VTYTYDSAGNLRTVTDAQHNSANRVGTYVTGNEDSIWAVSGDTLKYVYDADGNRTSRAGPGGTTTYSWSADGRLLSVTAGSHVINYGYGPTERLMQRSFGSVVDRYYLWDRDNLLAEIDSTGANRLNEYVPGLRLDQPLARVTGTGAGTIHYYQSDAVGNIIGQFTGTTVEQDLTYTLLGQLTSVSTTTGDTTRLRWKGLYWEPDSTQLYYSRARWYDPVQRRFVSQDPLLTRAGLNVYTFGGGDHVNARDPSGKCYVFIYSPGVNCAPQYGDDDDDDSVGGGGIAGDDNSGDDDSVGDGQDPCAREAAAFRAAFQAWNTRCGTVPGSQPITEICTVLFANANQALAALQRCRQQCTDVGSGGCPFTAVKKLGPRLE